ncbi:FtsX-like permease family protein [Candidatus Peregrinibacteria bacterium]|nr:FtsX-like permease family protein [Candidatus Peregrinibacteria bacterium]
MSKKPLSSKLLIRSFKLAAINIWRNKLLSIATIFVTGTIIFIFNIILAINFIAEDALHDLNKKVDVTAYLKESTTYEEVEKIRTELEAIEQVEAVNYTSKEDALTQLKSTHPDISLTFEKYQLGNPLPASLSIITTHPKYHEAVSELLQSDRYQVYISNIVTANSPDNNIIASVSKNLVKLSDFTQQVIFWLILTFVIGGALIILNALQITIFTRKKEISVMKLVGASHWFIRLPFLIESIIYGISAVIISFLMIYFLAKNIEIDGSNLKLYYEGINVYQIFLAEIGATVIISLFSASIAIQEYLKKDLLED